MKKTFLFAGLILLVLILAAGRVSPATATPAAQSGDPVAHGKYLATIAGCVGCHTPLTPEGTPDESRQYSGGVEFDLGPLGKVVTSNLTSDEKTGLGAWTDEEIKISIRAGLTPDGRHLFPIMPYVLYSSMAESDLDALVAFLRTLPAIENEVPHVQVLPPEALPQIPIRTGIVAPDPSDTAARGKYLLESVIACTDCHTPVDPQSGQPIREKYFGGGQPYEGPWGIVYAANISPDEATGIGAWSDDEIKRIFREGVRKDGRRLVLMPWQEFAVLTDEDLNAVVHYLRNDVPPVNNQVPAAALNPEFVQYVEVAQPPAGPSSTQIAVILSSLAVVAVGLGVIVFFSRRRQAGAK